MASKEEVVDESPVRSNQKRSSLWASMFGGPNVVVGPRIAPLPAHLRDTASSASVSDDDSAAAILSKQIASEEGNAIQYRTCSWQKTAGLLFSEYIVLSMMSFPWSYSYLGLVPGLILTVVVALLVLYTSLTLWEFCLRHPEVRDICDIGQMLFWNKRWAWYWTAVMFLLNNTFIQALHVFVGAQYLNTMTAADSIACRTVMFAGVVALISWFGSLPRTFDMLSKLGTGSTAFTFVSVILATAFAGIQGKPAGYDPDTLGEPIVSIWTPKSTTLVTGMAAFMNMSYSFIGQMTLPSFIAEMRDPREFPKSVWACAFAQIIMFSIVGSVIYVYTGNQYMVTPAFGTLTDVYKKVSYSFMVPTIIFVGCLYASVTGRFLFFRLFQNTRHVSDHTVLGWASWGGILMGSWIMSFIIAEVIPFFSSLLSVMSSLFNCWFGFMFWALAYFRMRKVDVNIGRTRPVVGDYLSMGLNAIIMLTGVMYLTLGTYVSVQGIIDSFEAGTVPGVFSCASNGI
ncbi:transmembrane amino acid transporter protein-domain-containing protein [Emericellopsis atlantica]|uniref:Transmembrane amino acid transporter protein-domain-containing protein n=1 Tax=Emericellopsis atlantica TaxID=2614577 RepID=A0A9P8CLA5_9HYPO|nr:transmembrane amino acid transporter protein-domain-containing protein [Emericellopsis atlantica]KAG9249421.1 transmembrane amino acid transporter protein-domain-containing protein [Emericellopsis atlantica]